MLIFFKGYVMRNNFLGITFLLMIVLLIMTSTVSMFLIISHKNILSSSVRFYSLSVFCKYLYLYTILLMQYFT